MARRTEVAALLVLVVGVCSCFVWHVKIDRVLAAVVAWPDECLDETVEDRTAAETEHESASMI